MCEFLDSTRKLAVKKGLDPRQVVCPPDKQALCTGVDCACLNMVNGVDFEVDQQTSNLDKFYTKIIKHKQIVQKVFH